MTVASARSGDPDEVAAETVLAVLDSDTAQHLIAHLDSPRTARELARRSDVSRSSVYRTVDRLVDAGLVRTRTDVRLDGHHPTRYELVVETVTITVGDEGGLDLDLEACGQQSQTVTGSRSV